MISIVIPLYNKAHKIEETLNSVLAQTFQDFEIVIVDDGSTDGSAEIVAELKDSRIRIISQENAGVSAARNRGIQESKGEYIAFLDADDEWHKDYLETQFRMMQQFPSCSVFATNYVFRYPDTTSKPTIIKNLQFSEESEIMNNYFEVASTSHPPIWTSAVVIKKSAMISINGFPVGIKAGEDLLTWATLACYFKIAYHKTPKAIYNLPERSTTDLPKRRLDFEDRVSPILRSYYRKFPHIKGLSSYISHWHKMRASVAMRHGYVKETISESLMTIRYNRRNVKVLGFVILSMLPKRLRLLAINRG